MRKPSSRNVRSERGEGESPLTGTLQATFAVARDDRDGCSRYRASKMSALRIIRVVPRYYAPIFG